MSISFGLHIGVYVCIGNCEVSIEEPSPKSQAQLVIGVPKQSRLKIEVSIKDVVAPSHTGLMR